MATQISTRLKMVLATLATSLIVQALALYMFTKVDNIVHQTLYNYGLIFDLSWANPYWDNSGLLIASIGATMVLLSISIVLVLRFTRNRNASATLPGFILPIIVIGLNVFSIFIFTRLTQIVNIDLYHHGLQPSLDWGLPLQLYSILLYTLIGIPIAITSATPLLFRYGAKERIMTEKPGVILIKEKTARNRTFKVISSVLVATGIIALIASILFNSPIFTFMGLGLVFWGILFTYVRTEEYVKRSLLSAIAYPEIDMLNRIISELGFKGTPLYLPPKYFSDPAVQKAYIPEKNETTVPNPQQIRSQESKLFTNTPSGMLVTPPGSELTKLVEKTLKTDLTKVNLRHLQQKLPKLMINDLEIAQAFEMKIEADRIQITIENSPYTQTDPKKRQPGSPFGSAFGSGIACILAKTTGNTIIIERQQTSQDGRNLTINYNIIDEEAKH
jgi:hypothetical protein